MGLRITFDLSNEDLRHFRLIMAEASSASAQLSSEEIISATKDLIAEVRTASVPEFIQQRLSLLELLTRMVTDEEWRLPEDEKRRILNALAYFTEPEDLIPDHIPGLGFLDDAIMIELVVRELKHELDAFRDFCDYRHRESLQKKAGSGDSITRATWLKTRRQELQSRMRRRRNSDVKKLKRRSPLSLF